MSPLPKPCKNCNMRFFPSSRFSKFCDSCRYKVQAETNKRRWGHTTKGIWVRKKHQCPDCNKQFKYKFLWLNHLKEHDKPEIELMGRKQGKT